MNDYYIDKGKTGIKGIPAVDSRTKVTLIKAAARGPCCDNVKAGSLGAGLRRGFPWVRAKSNHLIS